MDGLIVALAVSAGVFGILALVFFVRFLKLRAELRSFREQISEIRTTDREQPVKVASFGVSSVELAKEINLLVEELRTAANRSAEEEKRVRTIMAGVSHDFRTPLTAADGYLQMSEELLRGILSEMDKRGGSDDIPGYADVQETSATEEGEKAHVMEAKESRRQKELTELRDYLKIVTERVRYLRSLSDEFFEVTYLDAKKDLPLTAVRFDTVLSEVILGQYEWMQEREIDMRMDIPEEQLTVSGDRHYLERILENLFSNARKYTRSFLEIRVDRTDSDVVLHMKNDMDSAVMIDPSHIFEPFYRAKERSGPGTGLGLYVVKELASAMQFQLEGKVEGEIFEICLSMPQSPSGLKNAFSGREDSSPAAQKNGQK